MPVALILVASVVVVSVAAWASKDVMRLTILQPWRVRHNGEVHRLLTAGWVHADVGHLFVNMFTLWFFAEEVTRALGASMFAVLYVSGVVLAYVPTTIRHMNNPRYASLGASGAVSAVLFSAILLHPTMKLSLMFLPIAIPAPLYGLGYLAWSAYRSIAASRRDAINHDAHFAGAIYGVAFTYALEPARVTHALTHLF